MKLRVREFWTESLPTTFSLYAFCQVCYHFKISTASSPNCIIQGLNKLGQYVLNVERLCNSIQHSRLQFSDFPSYCQALCIHSFPTQKRGGIPFPILLVRPRFKHFTGFASQMAELRFKLVLCGFKVYRLLRCSSTHP